MRRLFQAALVVTIAVAPASAENVDPAGAGFRYAWSENAGWIDLQPSGGGGPGMQVDDFEVRGWGWSENAGWISFSCRNTASCDAVDYRTFNDGQGGLTGRAWGENVGWIDLAPAFAGVSVDPSTGELAGRAWSENLGWITFAGTADSGDEYGVTVDWRCIPAPPAPSGVPHLTLFKVPGAAVLEWTAVSGAGGYDVVRGDLGALRANASFSGTAQQCLADNQVDRLSSDALDHGPDTEYWLVRAVTCGSVGTWDTAGAGQTTARDPELAAEISSCP